ncbi:MAG: PEP-CTERM sorting domain-containing protein [Tepidisphaeraceae bacterium]
MLGRLNRINRKAFLLAAAAGGVLSIISVAANAAIITGDTVNGNGNGTASVSILGNEIVILGKNFTAVGPIDITFDTQNNGSTTSYVIVGEGIANDVTPPVTFTDYHEQLGSGTDGNFLLTNTPVNFAGPDNNSAFTVMTLAPYTLDMSQGSVAPLDTLSVGFDLTVPDSAASTFTLRQYPTVVPEPASLGLLGLGSLALLARRRRA